MSQMIRPYPEVIDIYNMQEMILLDELVKFGGRKPGRYLCVSQQIRNAMRRGNRYYENSLERKTNYAYPHDPQ